MPEPAAILQMGPIGPHLDQQLGQRGKVLRLWEAADRDAALDGAAAGVRVVVTSVRLGCPAPLIERLPRLRAICSWGVGYETIDVAAAKARGIAVSNTPDVLDDCVADLAWGLLIAAARRTAAGDRYVKDGQWRAIGQFPLTTRVSGKRLGILGLGRIGEAIARRGAGFAMDVRYHNRRERPGVPYGYESSLVQLARWADFLVVACEGGASTRHLVSQAVIDALGAKGILVNIARGTVVDQEAMVRALAEGRLGGAGLDVLEKEPAVPPELLSMDQVVLMPHVGSATRETRRAMEQLVLDNVDSFLAGRGLLTPVHVG
ncbi:2-hydroxyacid dehydrogenase [Ramlibacter sp.]|uniref:2-hydroxyacid dehydrogenase n=1 Tax=Ramlibacter sp. TaxID=1917967 RepID=UPI002C5A95AA|nr:2-hydroxyacid dehydrogenase [Ramlibacter sp.]HWI83710.1 2-hydroxyacid dehydrogenase [Ramlibacter sp.]